LFDPSKICATGAVKFTCVAGQQVCGTTSGIVSCEGTLTAPTVGPPTAPTPATTTILATTTLSGTTTQPIPVSIVCTGNGFFPDPFNCRYFHDCRAGSGTKSILYRCNTGYVYYAPLNNCQLQASQSDCITIDCTGTTAYRAYYPYSYYYTNCGSKPTTTMYRCASTSQYFSTTSNTCVA
jgi:Chitin binding Peritrophin-A domain